MSMLWSVLSRRRPAAILAATGIASAVVFLARPAVAYAAGVDEETVFVFNTFAFLVWGALVMWMCAGFTMLESGSVRTKNASMICPEEHRALLDRRPRVLLHRVQPDVR